MAKTTLSEDSTIKVNLSNESNLSVNMSVDNTNYIPGYKEAEEQRRKNEEQRIANELERIENEQERENYFEDIQQKVESGYFTGEPGPEGPRGPKGPPGEPGYTPVKGVDYFDGEPGKDGVVYTAGTNIEITEDNVINCTATGGGGTLTEELDPTVPDYVKNITEADIEKWNSGTGATPGDIAKYVDLDTLSEDNPLILEHLELGVYALKTDNSYASLYVKAKESNTGVLKVDYVAGGTRILSYHFPISEATNWRAVATLGPASTAPEKNRTLKIQTNQPSGLDVFNESTMLVPESYIGQFIPSLMSGKTNTYESENEFNKLPTSDVTPTENNQLVNKEYVDTLITESGFVTEDTNTTYTLSKDGSTVKLTGSDGSFSEVTVTESSGESVTYDIATSTTDGLMSASDKSKLDSISAGANKTTVDSALSSSSTNPVQNKVVNDAIASIVQSGSNSNGSYIKYSDGTMICYGQASGTSNYANWWSFCYRTNEGIQVNFPATFTTAPIVTANPTNMLGGIFAVLIDSSTTDCFKFTGLKANGAHSSNYYGWGLTYNAIGRWK